MCPLLRKKKFITHHDICLCKNLVSFTLTLARPDVAAIFYDFAKKAARARFGQYSLLIVVVRAPRLKYMQMHRASSPCLAILPLQPLSSHVIILFFYFAKSSLRAGNRHDGVVCFNLFFNQLYALCRRDLVIIWSI